MLELEPQDGLDLFDHVAVSAKRMEKEFTEADDDWLQFAFLEGIDDDGDNCRSIVGPIDDLLRVAGADVTWRVLVPGLVEKFKAHRAVILLNTWQVQGTDADAGIAPSEHPNRIEVLTLMDVTSEGVKNAGMAKIDRIEGKPPTLGEWDDWSVADMQGRVVEGLVQALRPRDV